MKRRAKIIATLGPASDDPEVLKEMIAAGVNVVRLNLSHGTHSEHQARIDRVRHCSEIIGEDVGILADLQGPKIRIDRFKQGEIKLEVGGRFVLDTSLDADAGDEHHVGVTYKKLAKDVAPGDLLLLDDGQIQLEVTDVQGTRVVCKVTVGGTLSNNKGINRYGGGLSAAALTKKDKEDIVFAADAGVDFLAVSFPRHAEDMRQARKLFEKAGGDGALIAKIERAEAVDNITAIMAESEAVMVARGDLGIEIGDAELPAVQKRIIKLSRTMGCVSITATQMMDSMAHSPIPTRAEVLDVANAVLDGTDAVMLSQETAVGEYPVETVKAMDRVCLGAEKGHTTRVARLHDVERFDKADEAIAMSAMYLARHYHVRAIVAITESGSTTLGMSRVRSGIPIYALTRHERTRRRVTLYRGVYPLAFDILEIDPANVEQVMTQRLREHNVIEKGDQVVFTRGDESGIAGGTNTLKIVTA
ncbi:MAG: pyruvate kinase [Gammaproteobacteria bacterium]|nr:pyruvate kinase [Gammaproteobacteria bacterium]